MLLDTITDIIPLAIGIALSPIPIAAVVSTLLSTKIHKASAFLLGWSAGIMAIGLLVLLIPGLRMLNGDPTPLAGWLRIFLGGVLMMIAWRKWRQRPLPQASVEQPKFLAKIDSYRGWKTLLLEVTLSMLNPKNLILTSASPMAIYESKIVAKEKGIALLVFTVIASLSVCVPIVFTTLRRNQAHKILTDLKDWLIANNTSVTVTLLVVFAVLIVGNGLKIVF